MVHMKKHKVNEETNAWSKTWLNADDLWMRGHDDAEETLNVCNATLGLF